MISFISLNFIISVESGDQRLEQGISWDRRNSDADIKRKNGGSLNKSRHGLVALLAVGWLVTEPHYVVQSDLELAI